ncbi:hypothetical protein [Propionicimonas paludicola]|nr:hypothetical protein [Propionicimonas paludicola]
MSATRRRFLALGVLLPLLVATAAGYGLVAPDAYPGVTELQRQTWRAQDAVNLVAAVILILSSRRSAAGSWRGHLVQLGMLGWLAYCALHLAIGAVFTPVFLVYLAVVGLAGFGLLDGLIRVELTDESVLPRFPSRPTAVFLAVGGVGIAGLWLSEIVPGVLGLARPANLHLSGLPNPTWVLDLVWLIPWALAAAWQCWRGRSSAQLISVPLLVLLGMLSVAMLAVIPFALHAGLGADPVAGPQIGAFSIVFSVLGLAEATLIAGCLRGGAGRTVELRDSWWVSSR